MRPDAEEKPSAAPAPRLLKPADLPDNFTRSLYKIAPYRGCAHGCRYCDGRAERYYVEGDFERDVEVRRSIPERLERDLATVREAGMIGFGSGVTDPYQPLEKAELLTGRCAELLAAAPRALPAMVMTKSSLVRRDLPAWSRVNESSGFLLMVSLTSLDEELREAMEPGASSFAERLAALRAFKEAGCAVGVLAMPLLPGLSDGEDSIRALYAACAEIGVDFVMPGGLTLRPGRQKDFYLAKLGAFRPELVEPTAALFREDRLSGSPLRQAAAALFERLAPIRRDFGLPYLLPHAAFARFLPAHDALRLLYRDMIELYAERGTDTARLRASAERYDAWLVGLRRAFRRKRSLPADWLEERFDEASRSGELESLLDNPRLAAFTRGVLLEEARLDYGSLTLVEAPRAAARRGEPTEPLERA
ncbi:MAG TPA: radical SAM protein [Spirochaetales bacterium]|nr:radical SAM protein [Spirochaetales bacterium]